ncbi:MAG: circadian clock KaiB family protein [Pseudomonadota bacterium]
MAPRPVPQQTFRLYVSSASPASSRAMVNARRFFEEHLPGAHRLDVLDIAEHVEAARADQIFASPTLVRLTPLPQRRLIGDLSDTERMRVTLGLARPSGGTP